MFSRKVKLQWKHNINELKLPDLQGNFTDPLILSNSDHPCSQLVATNFDGANYMTWVRGIMMALGAKNKLGFIAGSCAKPTQVCSMEYQKWVRADYMVRCWMLNSMSSTISEGFMYVDSSKQLSDELRERYGQTNGPLIYQLKRKLAGIVQGSLTVGEYFHKLKRIWDELQVLEGIPICTCGVMSQCTCEM